MPSPVGNTADDWRAVAAEFEGQLSRILAAMNVATADEAVAKYQLTKWRLNRARRHLASTSKRLVKAQARIDHLTRGKPPRRGRNHPETGGPGVSAGSASMHQHGQDRPARGSL